MLLAPRTRGDLLSDRIWSDRLWDIRREMDRLFDRFWTEPQSDGMTRWAPPVDITETDQEIRCAVELPGFRPDDIEVTVEDNVLTVSGERHREHKREEAEGEYRLFERRYGRFERSFTLPRTVEAEHVEAHYENGVLQIVLPKTEEARPRRIPIEASDSGRKIEAGG